MVPGAEGVRNLGDLQVTCKAASQSSFDFGVQGLGFRVSGFRGSGFRCRGLGLKGTGLSVHDSEFGVQGLELRACG